MFQALSASAENQILDELGRSHEGTARRVLERMVSVEAGEFARRRVPRREFTTADRDENRRTEDVLQRLIDARLVVVDAVNNDPYLELAHDALILGWDRLLTWVLEDAERIIALRRLTSDAFKWVHSPKANKGLLWDDPVRLADVRALLTRGFPGLNQVESAFAQASEKRERRNQIVRTAVTSSLILITFAATTAALIAVSAWNDADKQRLQAEASERRALHNRDQALLSQSHYLDRESKARLDGSDPTTAELIALEALPDRSSRDQAQRERPYVSSIEEMLYSTRYRTTEISSVTLASETSDVTSDGLVVATASASGDVRMISVQSKVRTDLPKRHRTSVAVLRFDPSGQYLISAENPIIPLTN